MTSRRGLLGGIVGFVACAPAIVRASSIMPVKSLGVIDIDPFAALEDFVIRAYLSVDGVQWESIGELIEYSNGLYRLPKRVEMKSGDTLQIRTELAQGAR